MPVPRTVDINLFHASYGHAHEGLLRRTAKDLGVTLSGTLQPCTGCSLAKGLRKGISSSTENRATKKLGRVFVDLSGPKPESEGRKRYTLIVRDDYSRMSWVYFLHHKSDAADAFERFLVDVRADGMPSSVEIVRSDGGGEFEGRFADLCRTRGIKQEFTTADSPEYNGVAERALGLIDASARAAVVQAQELYPHVELPSTDSLWAETYR